MRSKVPEGRSWLASDAKVPRCSPRPVSRMDRIWAMMLWACTRKDETVERRVSRTSGWG